MQLNDNELLNITHDNNTYDYNLVWLHDYATDFSSLREVMTSAMEPKTSLGVHDPSMTFRRSP